MGTLNHVTGYSAFDYQAFGGVLRSEIELPDFVPTSCDRPHWEVRTSPTSPPEEPCILRGEFEPLPDFLLRLFDIRRGVRLKGDRIGTWDILDHGREIVWFTETPAQKEFFRTALLGPVLALVMEQHALVAMHGSAVSLGGSGVTFLGPKLHGKSTLALALTLSGGRLITDDLVAVELGNPSVVRPGAHGVRLFGDSVEKLSASTLPGIWVGEVKQTLTALPFDMTQAQSVPLAAMYLVEPVYDGDRVPAAERERLSPSEATIGLALRAKLADDLIGLRAAGTRLGRLATLATSVPIYRLRLVRDWKRLPEIVRQILEWHCDAVASDRRVPTSEDVISCRQPV